jgi:hypothetical protein
VGHEDNVAIAADLLLTLPVSVAVVVVFTIGIVSAAVVAVLVALVDPSAPTGEIGASVFVPIGIRLVFVFARTRSVPRAVSASTCVVGFVV